MKKKKSSDVETILFEENLLRNTWTLSNSKRAIRLLTNHELLLCLRFMQWRRKNIDSTIRIPTRWENKQLVYWVEFVVVKFASLKTRINNRLRLFTVLLIHHISYILEKSWHNFCGLIIFSLSVELIISLILAYFDFPA